MFGSAVTGANYSQFGLALVKSINNMKTLSFVDTEMAQITQFVANSLVILTIWCLTIGYVACSRFIHSKRTTSVEIRILHVFRIWLKTLFSTICKLYHFVT